MFKRICVKLFVFFVLLGAMKLLFSALTPVTVVVSNTLAVDTLNGGDGAYIAQRSFAGITGWPLFVWASLSVALLLLLFLPEVRRITDNHKSK